MVKIIVVNDEDEVIDSIEREDVNNGDIYRVSALWIENSRGDVLLAQRSFSKSQSPGKWGPAVSGTVDEGETYDENIKKEAEEEIGLVDCDFKKIEKVRVHHNYNFFCQWYEAILDRNVNEFKIDPKEVEQIQWFSKEELERMIKIEPKKVVRTVGEFISRRLSQK